MNVIKPARAGIADSCRRVSDGKEIADSFAAYMTDESRLSGVNADAIYFPRSTEEVAAAVAQCARGILPIVVSGGRTGIVGGAAVTQRSSVICLEGVKTKPEVRRERERNEHVVRVCAGTTVAELDRFLKDGGHDAFYPVDPTETSAHLGGTVATNASGARTLFYGPTREWVERIRVVLADGRVLDLRRGEVTADGLEFLLEDASGSRLPIRLPEMEMPSTKNTAGYFVRLGMDAVDLFVGSEGTLGIITEMELRLTPRSKENLYVCQYLDGEDAAFDFVEALRNSQDFPPLALEYFDPNSVALLREKRRQQGAASGVPELSGDTRAVVYTEFLLSGDASFEAVSAHLERAAASAGSAPERSWAGFQRKDLDRMKELRHALPETVNSIIAQRKSESSGVHKVGTDMAVPFENLREMVSIYRSRLDGAGFEYVVFGHVGDGHLHVNILPRNVEELCEAKRAYAEFAREAVRLGGSVSAEHGIGRLKKEFLAVQYSSEIIAGMRAVKDAFDPDGLLNPGVIF